MYQDIKERTFNFGLGSSIYHHIYLIRKPDMYLVNRYYVQEHRSEPM